MEAMLKADIFFLITTICVVLLTLGGLIIIIHIFRIVRNVEEVTNKVRGFSGILNVGNFFKKKKSSRRRS